MPTKTLACSGLALAWTLMAGTLVLSVLRTFPAQPTTFQAFAWAAALFVWSGAWMGGVAVCAIVARDR